MWAAGNDGGDGSASLTNPPGQDPTPGIVSVASYFDQATGTRDGVVSDYSSRGNRNEPSSGTSMAAPHIAGIVAQLFHADPSATPGQIEAALKSTAHRYTNGAAYSAQEGYTTSFDKGTGLVDVVAAVDKIAA